MSIEVSQQKPMDHPWTTPPSLGGHKGLHTSELRKSFEMCIPLPTKLANRDSIKTQDLYYFRERFQTK